MTNLKERLEKRRDELAQEFADESISPHSSWYDVKFAQDDLIPVIVKLAEALESIENINSSLPKKRHDAQWTVDFMRKKASTYLEELEAWVGK